MARIKNEVRVKGGGFGFRLFAAACFRLRNTMMRQGFVTGLVVAASLLQGFTGKFAEAQGTKLWSVSHYDEMEKGSAEGVAIRNDGRLEAGPAISLLYATGKNYVWSLAADAAGNGYLGL